MRIRRLTATGITALGVLAGGLACSCAQAGASVSHGLSSSFGSFTTVQSIAVDESSGAVYVYDVGTGSLDKFDAAGQPAEFSALKADAITGLGGAATEAQVAVDDSGTATQGDIYVANGSVVKIYGPDGKSLGELNGEVEAAGGPWGGPCGVAVDASGHVYVGLLSGHVNRYTPAANPVKNADYAASLSGLPEICNVAADAQGDVYAEVWQNGPVMKYPASQFGQPQASGTSVEEGRDTLAVDPADQDLYIDQGESIVQRDATGNRLDVFGGEGTAPLSHSVGVAIDGTNDRVYAADNSRKRVDIFEPLILPDVAALQVSGVTATSATVAGTVNPEGLPVTSCEFAYLGYTIDIGLAGNGFIERTVACVSSPGSGSAPVAVAAELTNLAPNTQYYVRPMAANANGAVKLGPSLEAGALFQTPAISPAVDDQSPSASSITRTSAVLVGTVNPEHSATSYRFAYGATTSYGRESVPVPAGSTLGDRAAVSKLEGLAPGTTYHYALVASNQAGTVTGRDNTFTTPASSPPALSGVAVENLGPGAATIVGTVESNGLPTTYEIEFGADTSYATRQAGEVGGGSQGVSLALLYLQPGATYHYRIVASNEDGSAATADQSFTTPPYQLQIPPVLPPLTTPAMAFPAGSQANTAKPPASPHSKPKARRRAKHVHHPKKKKSRKG
jgi:hypothetical protein